MAEQIPLCVLLDEFTNPVGVKQFPTGDTLPAALIPALPYVATGGFDAAVQAVAPAVKIVAATAYTIVPADANYLIIFTAATAVTVTVAAEASGAWPTFARVDLLQQGAGKVSVAGAGFTVVVPATLVNSLAEAGAGSTLIHSAADVWNHLGMLEAAP